MSKPEPVFSIILRIIISLILITVLIAGGGLGFQFFKSLKKPPERASQAKPRTAVRVMRASLDDYTERFSGYGLARALRRTEVQAEVVGLVQWVSPNLESGRAVTEGEVLVKLDDRDFRETVASAKASIAHAEAARDAVKVELEGINRQLIVAREELATAKRELGRLQSLQESGNVSSSMVDQQSLQTSLREHAVVELEVRERANRPAMDRADAQVALGKAQLARAENNFARAVIRAPYAGRIEQRYVQLGARVGPGVPLFRIVDPSKVEVPISVGATHFGEVEEGAPVTLRSREDRAPIWTGEVARIAPSVNSQERTFTVFVVVESENESVIPPGGFVIAHIDGPVYREVMVVPRAALFRGKLFVAKRVSGAKQQAVAHERAPNIRKTLADVVLIDGGLKPGEEVILTNVAEIADGSRVSLVQDDGPLAATPDPGAKAEATP